jgi:type I restriction enzyme M protein
LPTRTDFTFPTSNKQFCFLQHIYRGLSHGGRAAVVQPDNVLFEGNTGRQIRADLMDKCNLHTILRLPTGIFYSQGVKTNVLFFTRGETDKGNTREVWVYDLRANMPQFGKRTVLTRAHFTEFEAAFGDDPLGSAGVSPSVKTLEKRAVSVASPATGSPSVAITSTLPGSRSRTKAQPTSYPSRPCSRRKRWTSSKERWRNCEGFWRNWARRLKRDASA